MGLSIAISGAIILSVLMIVLMTITGFVGNVFTVGDASTQISELEKTISDTEISLDALEAQTNSALVNFTLNNDDIEKLWNFENFNVLVQYENATDTFVEELSFNGDCSGIAPIAGNWCIETIGADILDEGIINDGESADIWTQVSKELDNANALVTVSTDNGVVAMLPAPKRSWFDAAPIPTITCEVGNYGRTFIDTDTGISYVCDPTKDKWLSLELVHFFGDETGTGCTNGEDVGSEADCSVDWGNGIGSASDALEVGLYLPYNATIIAYAVSWEDFDCTTGTYDLEIWGSGSGSDDENYFFANGGDIATGFIADAVSGTDANLDVPGDQFFLYGVDNNCSADNGSPEDWAMNIFLRWHHDDP